MKNFDIESSDLQFLQEQNSSPIVHIISYDANGQAIYGFTRPVANSHGAAGVDVILGALGTFNVMTSEWAEYIPGNSSGVVANNGTSPFGLRNVSGLFNNLTNPSSYDWGAIDHPFARLSNSSYDRFLPQSSANPAFKGQIKPNAADQITVDSLAKTPWQNLTGEQKKLVQNSNWNQTSITFSAGADGIAGNADDEKSIENSQRYSNPFLTVSDYTPRLVSQLVNSSYDAAYATAHPGTAPSAQERIEASVLAANPTAYTTETSQYFKTDRDGNRLKDASNNDIVITEKFQRNSGGGASLTGWHTLFGQFLDHGLDSIGKGGNKVDPNAPGSKIIVPLAPTDPLYNNDPARGPIVTTLSLSRATVSNPQQAGADGKFRTADDILSPGVDGVYGNSDDVIGATNPEYINHVSPFIDQSQTYGSSEDITNLLREWVLDPKTGQYAPGMKLLDGYSLANAWTLNNPDGTTVETKQTLPTVTELRAYLLATGRDDLTWEDIGNFRARDAHGKVLDQDKVAANGIQAISTGNPLLLDMLPQIDLAHINAPGLLPISGFSGNIADYVNPLSGQPVAGLSAANMAIANEILLRSIGDHYVAGDGRANENFGLTAVHHVWHEDHNWQIDNLINSVKQQQLDDPTHTAAHGWQNIVTPVVGDVVSAGITTVDGHYQDAQGNYVDKAGKISWNQEKMFQAATLIVQMEYQHVAIDQYARGMSPNIPQFVAYDSSINPDVSLDYSQAAFRFGHSQLRETIDVLDPNGSLSGMVRKFALEQAFLNPTQFAANGPTAIVQGMTRQVSSEIDEILTPALQQALLGQPQDLAAINIMRGRDLGIPALNTLRRNLSNGIAADLANLQQKLLANPSDAVLQEKIDKTISLQVGLNPYNSWNDFAKNLIHPDALVNFLAAYALDGNLDKANMLVKLGHGGSVGSLSAAEAAAYENLGWTASNARTNASTFLGASSAANKSFENIDAWVGGLAEKHIAGGQLGATFDAIFADQMTRLINGDRFYYFWRLQLGLPQFTQLIDSVSTEQFKDVIERTTGAEHLTGDVFLLTDSHIELGETPASNEDDSDKVTPDAVGHQYGDKVTENKNVVNADGTAGIGVYSDFGYDTSTDGQVISVNLANYGLADHSYIRDTRPDVGQNPDSTAASGFNSHETIAGTKFADFLDAGDGDDTEYGEDGNDILIGNNGGDHLYGGDGDDYLSGDAGSDFLDGDDGNDQIHGGDGEDVLIGSDGNDSLYGESSADELHGNSGDDYLNGGSDADQLFGGYGNDILLGEEGLDAVYGEWGDDQIFGGGGPDQLLGGQGDDILHGGSGSNNRSIGVDQSLGEEGFNISSYNELLVKLDVIADLNFQNVTPVGSTAPQVEPFGQLLTNIQGLEGTGFDDQLIGDASDNWLIGGGGNDIISGGAGNDVIIGDRVRLDLLDGKYTSNTLGAGLLDLIPAGGGKHFTDLLKSYPNFVFGQDAGAIGTNDIVTYTGALSDFTITRIKDASGNVINDANGKSLGLRVVDKRLTGAETTAVGDLLIGVDRLVFNYDFESIATAGSTAHSFINPANLPLASALDVYTGSVSISSVNGANSASLTASVTDPNMASTPSYAYQWYSSTDQGVTSTLIPGATLATQSAVSNSLSKVVVSYSDAFGANTLTSSWVQVGTSGNDNLTGSVAANNTLIGLDGSDRLTGGEGNDTMDGGAGNDVLDSHGDSTGVDSLIGGSGDDVYGVYNSATTIVENAGAGNDTVWTAVNYTLSANIENMYLVGNLTGTGNAENNLIVGYEAGNNTIYGLGGDDSLDGGAGDDYLNGGVGNDSLDGGTGDDYLNGGIGDDSLIGGIGNDTLDGAVDSSGLDTFTGGAGDDIYGVYNSATTIVENAGEGNDTVWTAVNYTLAANVENMYLVGSLTGIGNAENNLIVGYGAGNNTINGLGGNDTLDGGAGADTMSGGAGADIFAFQFGQSSATVTDRVLDFTINTDQIDLFTPAGVAAPAPTSFSRANDDSSANLSNLAVGVYANADGAGHGLVAGGAALVVSTGAVSGTYLVIDDGVAGFDANNDLVINITGYTGALPSIGVVPAVSSFFKS